jgi:uncharacterized repeat protein (TIGR01451 family)
MSPALYTRRRREMDDVALRRRLAALVIAALLAVLLVSVAALLWTQQAKAQEPCNFDFCIDKTANAGTVEVGQQITFTITQRCIAVGFVCVTSGNIVDELPSGLSFVSVEDSDPNIQCTSSGNTVTCPGTRLIATDSPFTATIVATTTKCGEFTNTASDGVRTGQATFTVVGCPPPTKAECKNGGWSNPALGFPDQGTCVSAWNRQNRQ